MVWYGGLGGTRIYRGKKIWINGLVCDSRVSHLLVLSSLFLLALLFDGGALSDIRGKGAGRDLADLSALI